MGFQAKKPVDIFFFLAKGRSFTAKEIWDVVNSRNEISKDPEESVRSDESEESIGNGEVL